MATAREVADWLDLRLGVPGFPDYPVALNGLQLDHVGPVRRIATAVDFSGRTIDATIEAGANMLILHHGMFWGGLQRLTGTPYLRLRRLMAHDVAVYAAHLPLDAHPELGNCALLARELGLDPTTRFHEYQGVAIGVAGNADLATDELVGRARAFAARHGGTARATTFTADTRTRHWAVITGAGADTSSLRLAASLGLDTLIVGEGPHHTTVDAPEAGLVVIYAGHYATETLGVRAIARAVSTQFGVPAEFLPLPTGS